MPKKLIGQALSNIGWGIMRGLILAATYAVIALVIFAVNPGAFDANDTTLPEVLVIYFLAGAAGGAIIGAARPLLSRKRTAYAPAVVAMTIAVFGTFIILEGHPENWTGDEWITIIIAGPLFGVLGVHSIWRETGQPD